MLVFLVFCISFISSVLSNISGGAGSIINLPALLALGVPPVTAIGSMKAGGLGIVLGTSLGSHGKKLIRKEHVIPLLISAAAASLLGPQLSLHLSSHAVKVVSSILIVVTALFSLFSWRQPAESRAASKKSQLLGYGAYFVSTGLLAAFSSGIGLISTYILMNLIGMSALEAVSTRRLVGLVAAPLQFFPFFFAHKVDLGLGLAMFFGCLLGGYLGLLLAVRGGNEFIKRCMAVSAIVLLIFAFI